MITLGILLSLLLSAIFSGSEIAFVSANKLKIELRKKRGTYQSVVMANFFDRPSSFLSTMLVGNNIALVIFSTLMSIPLDNLIINYLGIQSDIGLLLINTVAITIVVLIFGEFLPKTLFRLYPDSIIYGLAVPLRVLQLLLAVPSWVMTKTSDLLLGVFFRQSSNQLEETFTRIDLENFINETHPTDEVDSVIDAEMFGKALNLYDVRVRDCMVPRKEIESIEVTASLDELVDLFKETRLSRLLITEADMDNVLGYVHHQQLLSPATDIRSLILDIPFVPEVMRVTDLMDKFIKDRLNIACVVDEFGGVAGIITLEDILEEIFGEIEDEYDEVEHIEVDEGNGTYLFSGRLEIDYLNDKYDLYLPEGDYQTLSGYLVQKTATIPDAGEFLETDGFRLEVVAVSNTRVETIRVYRLSDETTQPPGAK